jgi:hypothetical protein
VKDDVHTELANDHQILVQLKHTVQLDKDGNPKNLTTLDTDLWKTLSNWSRIICDVASGRSETKAQLEFVRKTEFLLVSNKSESTGNELIKALEAPATARAVIKTIREEASGEQSLERIDRILALDNEVLQLFMQHMSLQLGEDAIIQLCKDAIEEKQIPPGRVNDLFAQLDSRIREDNFIAIRAGEKVEIQFEEFNRRYRRFFDIARSEELVIQKQYKPFPDSLLEQTFIKQLRDIGDISDDDVELMARYTLHMLTVDWNLEYWFQQGDLTSDEIENFKAEARLKWEHKFRSVYRTGEDSVVLALKVLDAMREVQLSMGGQFLGTEFSNGKYYLLANVPEIGWLRSWEEKYK